MSQGNIEKHHEVLSNVMSESYKATIAQVVEVEQEASMMIPGFRDDGHLPDGVHAATETEVTFRFGSSTPRRRRLILRLRRWLQLARLTHARRFLVDGSFVTAKRAPNGIDAVVLLADDFTQQVSCGMDAALELEEMLLTGTRKRSLQPRIYVSGTNG